MVAQRDSRDARVEVHLDAIRQNVQAFGHHLGQQAGIMAVVKANAYGHGAEAVARTAIRAGASWLGVAFLGEALALRKAGIQVPILVFGRVSPEDAWLAAKHHISLTVFQQEWLHQAQQCQPGDVGLDVHLKLDTGMGRIGVCEQADMQTLVQAIQTADCFRLQGVYTHFATADESDSNYFRMQYDRFKKMLGWLQTWEALPDVIHCANSATALYFPGNVHQLARIGIAMYGLAPAADRKSDLPIPLHPAFSLQSRLIHVKQLDGGEAVSYGAEYITKGKEWIGTVPIGYADGWLRKIAENGGEVLVDGERVPIVGKICMDFFMVRLPAEKNVGTRVTLIGRQADACIEVDEIARMLATINYEIPCMIQDRIPRIYNDAEKNAAF